MIKDNTKTQAARWVIQEFEKSKGRAAERLKAERDFLKMSAGMGFEKTLPNSHQAHLDLIARLEALI